MKTKAGAILPASLNIEVIEMKYYYPAIFRPKSHIPEGYDLNVVDIEGCLTHGDDIAECMEMAQDAIAVMLEDVSEKDYPVPSDIKDVDISAYPAGSFVSYVCFDSSLSTRAAILNADNPIKELLTRRNLKPKQFSEMLNCPYRTCQDWALGKSKPPRWVLNLILDKVLD